MTLKADSNPDTALETARDSLEQSLLAALADLPGKVVVEVQAGRYGALRHHGAPGWEWDDQVGLLALAQVKEIPDSRYWIRSLPWVRLDQVEPEDYVREVAEAVTETSRAMHLQYARLTDPTTTPEETLP